MRARVHSQTRASRPRGNAPLPEGGEDIVLAWLAGKLSPELGNQRVAVLSYGENGWLGHESEGSGEFFDTYSPITGELRQVPLKLSELGKSWHEAASKIGQAIVSLKRRGRIIPINAPDQYDGVAVFYGLTPLN